MNNMYSRIVLFGSMYMVCPFNDGIKVCLTRLVLSLAMWFVDPKLHGTIHRSLSVFWSSVKNLFRGKYKHPREVDHIRFM